MSPEPIPSSPVIWDESGLPRSRLFDDVYFSAADGLAESRAVFLQGCGLPEAWAGRRQFTVGELGFGSGLNIVALLDLWRRTCEPGARLHIFSIEAFPMPVADAARVLGAWPEVGEAAAALLARWPGGARGFHRLELAEWGAVLDLAVMDAAEAIAAWSGSADAWFLDGFSPAANPGMWSAEVLSAVARRSAPGARVGTFTVAGAVRRELAAQGFTVDKRPGFGRKRERLEAVWPGAAPVESAQPSVAIVGAGIAGAALARAFAALGVRPVVVEPEAPGAGASGNPAALVMPRLDAGGGPVAQLYAQAFARAADLYAEAPEAQIAQGARAAEVGPRDGERFDRIAAGDLFEPHALERIDGGLRLTRAPVVDPQAVLDAWLAPAQVVTGRVEALEPDGEAWVLRGASGHALARAQAVCLASGLDLARLFPEFPLGPVRGQVSFAALDQRPQAMIGGGYVIPTRDGLLFGATHDRGDEDAAVRPADHARNLAQLAEVRPDLAAALDGVALDGRGGVRAATPDFLPLAGAIEGRPGLFVLSGLGSRGFCAAPLLAEHVAALALGAPSPLPASLAEIVDPARFERRRARRTGAGAAQGRGDQKGER